MIRKILFTIFMLIFGAGVCYAQNTLQGMQSQRSASSYGFVLRFSHQPTCKVFALRHPERIVVDCSNTDIRYRPLKSIVAGTVAKSLRYSKQANKLRLVWDLKQRCAFRLERGKDLRGRFKLVLWLTPLKQQVYSAIKNSKPLNTKTGKPSKTIAGNTQAAKKTSSLAKTIKSTWPRETVIVIDPGHGGKDPGATGINHVHEKNVVLAISKYLQRDINSKPGFKAYLTRNRDVFLSLRQRMRVARAHHADMFVAIHADAFRNHEAHGASVFALSLRGATSEAARWLAERENASELIGGVDLADKDRTLRSVLIDLSQTATIRTSIAIGSLVLKDLSAVAKLHHRHVEQAAFVVLKSPDIPSLLIETGFLSNRREAQMLRRSSYQKTLAKSISNGLTAYFTLHPLPGTWLALRKRTKVLTYIIRSGDSLSILAQRFAVSMQSIKQYNRMRSDNLRQGQKILIPLPHK